MHALDCTDIKALLSGLLDDEVDRETRHEAERHISECSPCRTMLNEAERFNALILQEAAALAESRTLPEGFESAVLSRTVYAEAFPFVSRKWTGWLGWMAAAASVILAASVWFIDRQVLPRHRSGDSLVFDNQTGILRTPYLTTGRSWTYDGEIPAESLVLATSSVPVRLELLDRTSQSDHLTEMIAPTTPDTLAALSRSEELSPADSDALSATGLVLDLLAQADLASFADVEVIRRIVEYDELPVRLAVARQHVRAVDRPIILAAESVLWRIAQGPLDLNDLRELHDTVAQLELASSINSMSTEPTRSHPL